MSLPVTTTKYIFLILALNRFVECKNFQIVGGQPASISDVPFQIVYFSSGDFVCSGSLISPLFVLTAAHCTYYFPSEISIRFGSSFRKRDGIVINVVRYYTHPLYNYKTYDYDFAILKLATSIKFTKNIQPALLPSENTQLPVGVECTVSGWGLQSFNDLNDPPERLMAAKVKVFDFQSCYNNYKRLSYFLTDRMFCAGQPDAISDSCLGDSGGPLVCNGTLYGVVSFGYGCAMRDFPGIYSRISSVLLWIKRIAQLT